MQKMLTKDEIIDRLRKEFSNLKNQFGVKKIGIFGSFAKGLQKEDSDIDIIVEFDIPIGLEFVDFAEFLENLFNKKVDILTPDGIKSIRIKRVADDIERSIIYAW